MWLLQELDVQATVQCKQREKFSGIAFNDESKQSSECRNLMSVLSQIDKSCTS